MIRNLYCDNYSTCNEVMFDRGGDHATRARARAAGWHLFDGLTYGGEAHQAVLGPLCVGARRRLAPAPAAQPGQPGLFEVTE